MKAAQSVIILGILLFSSQQMNAQVWNESIQFTPPLELQRIDYQYYGLAVAIDGDFAVVAENRSKVYVLWFDGDQWLIQCELTPSDGHDFDYFGREVDISGNTIVVGAFGNNSNGKNSGAVYVFVKPEGMWQNTTETAKILASDGQEGDSFGKSVRVSGDQIVVGAVDHEDNGYRSGAAYVFTKPEEGWSDMVETGKLLASDNQLQDLFGSSVDISGDYIVVGAPQQDEFGQDAGAVYVYAKPADGWKSTTQTAKLYTSDQEGNDFFGTSVSISGDQIAAGSTGSDGADLYAGSVYVYSRPIDGWSNMSETAKLIASDGERNDRFGRFVQMIEGTVVVGDSNDDENGYNSGSVYVFSNSEGSWANMSETAKLLPSGGAGNELFGASVGISESNIIVGATGDKNAEYYGASFIYKKPDEGWTNAAEVQKTRPPDYLDNAFLYYGKSVAIEEDLMVIGQGNGNYEHRNVVHVFEKQGSDWEKTALLTASDWEEDNYFGESVAIFGDDVVVGSAGSVYVFTKMEGGWSDMTQTAKLALSSGEDEKSFGLSVDIFGSHIVAGVDNDRAAYIFSKPEEGEWVDMTETATLTPPDGSGSGDFGFSVSIYENTVVVGAPGSGIAYVFEKPELGWVDTSLTLDLTASDAGASDLFGRAVFIHDNTVVVGAVKADGQEFNTGAAYVFEKPELGWIDMNQTAKLTSSQGSTDGWFGYAIDMIEDRIAIGAIANNSSGSAYMFIKPDQGWEDMTEAGILTPTNNVLGDNFGAAVGITNESIVIGAPYFDDAGKDAGAVYSFSQCTPTALFLDNEALDDLFDHCEVTMPETPTATNNCGAKLVGIPDVEFPIINLGETTITWTFADLYGNSMTQTQLVSIVPIDNSVRLEYNAISAEASDYQYQWIDCEGEGTEIFGATDQVYSPKASGIYRVELSDGKCAVLSACTQITIVGLEERINNETLIYPNPLIDIVTIEMPETEAVEIELLSLDGKSIKDYGLFNRRKFRLDIGAIKSGIYLLRVESPVENDYYKIIVE